MIDDFSTNNAQLQTVFDAYDSKAENLPSNASEEVGSLRNAIGRSHGGTNWYEYPLGNEREGFDCSQASSTTITVTAGKINVDGQLVYNATDTTLTLTTVGDWVDDTKDQATDTRGYIYINASGKIEMDVVAPDESDVSGNTSGLLRYCDTGTDTTDRRIIGGFYMNGTGSGELAAGAVWSFGEGGSGWEQFDAIDVISLATADFATIPSIYNRYQLVVDHILGVTDGAFPTVRVSTSASFKAGASDYEKAIVSGWGTTGDANAAGNGDITVTAIPLGVATGTGTNETVSGIWDINDLVNASSFTWLNGVSNGRDSNGVAAISAVGGRYLTAEVNDGMQVIMTSGNITSGTIKLYGMK